MLKNVTSCTWRRFDELTVAELYALLRLRCDVFIVEQRCAFPDIDGRDLEASHLLAWNADHSLVGYLRMFAPAGDGEAARIQRVATAPAARSVGLGRQLMQEALAGIEQRHGRVPVELSAQSHLEHFYASLGFIRCSDDYLEDGIPHCDMRRPSRAVE